MAAIVITPGSDHYYELHVSGGRVAIYEGEGTFNSTDTTGTLKVRVLNRITGYSFDPIGAAASDGTLSLSDTEAGNGDVSLGAAKTVTVQRAAGTTSALKFKFQLRETLTS